MLDPNDIIKQLEQLKTWRKTDFPRLAAVRSAAYFKNNFRLQGYQDNGVKKWQSRSNDPRKGGAILIGKQSGILRDSLRAFATATSITIQTDRIYAQIHNEGGTINQVVTAKQKGFFWAKHYEAKERDQLNEAERWKRMALSKTLTVNIPQRQFMPIPLSGQIPFELSEILRGDVEKKLSLLIG